MASPACDGRSRFSRDRLLHLCMSAGSVSPDVDSRVRCLGLRAVCRLRCLHSSGRIGPVVSSSTSQLGQGAVCSYRGRRAEKARPSVEHHSVRHAIGFALGCLNIRSVGNKLDDLLDVCRNHASD